MATAVVPHRYTLFPIDPYWQESWEYYEAGIASNWPASEVDLKEDLTQFNKLPEDQQHVALTVLAFFAVSDGIVQDVIAHQLFVKTPVVAEKMFYGWQIYNEGIHAQVYSLLVDA